MYKVFKPLVVSFVLLALYSCSKDEQSSPKVPFYGEKAMGSIPAQLNNEMYVGLFENRHYDWMANSGIPWNSRYMYLVPGWADNWGLEGEKNGNYAYEFLEECDALDALPYFQFYILNDIGPRTDDLYWKTTEASLMKEYFEEYILLLNRIKEFGKPVVVMLEADGFAVLQQQTESNPNAYSAVADCGIPELANLPNTMAGWGMAFLELKQALEVDNVTLGIHISAWATREDIAYSSAELPLEPEVDKVYDFLAPMGLVPNQTGLEFDFLVADPSDRDADYFRIEQDQDKWWDPSPDASLFVPSFNRFAEWLRIWNVKTQKRWIVWQIPLGNKHHLNVPNTDQPQEGYKDNRVEYFLGANSTQNIAKWADSGVIALLFGRGADHQAHYLNDHDNNGNLYFKPRAAAYYDRGVMHLKR
jgi:hypothetical protein